MKRSLKILPILLFSFLLTFSNLYSEDWDRRKDQFENTGGYLVVPAPYEFPGIGSGLMLIGYAGNLLSTSADIFAIAFQGDAEGYITSLGEAFIVPDYLYLTLSTMKITSFGVNMYSTRGMDTEKDDYSIFVGDLYQEFQSRLTLTLFDRRLEFTIMNYQSNGRATSVNDSEGELITEYPEPVTFENQRNGAFLNLDFTDDFRDPRTGIRFRAEQFMTPAIEADNPEYRTLNYSLSYYLPLFKDSTWAFNIMRSDAIVSKKGDTDFASLKAKSQFVSCQGDPACETSITNDINNTINANKHGTATSLGGPTRLRAYPNGRYQSAHTQFYGTEFRWNLSTESSEIDWYFLQDVQQAIQAAFFWEQGSVAETASELGDINRTAFGAGLRLVTKSGNLYRFDLATGDEGLQVTLLFGYPWEPSF